MDTTPRIAIPHEAISEFCRQWQVTEFALFGSVLRDDFGPESDIDVLVAFSPQATHSLFDLVRMEDELRAVFGRRVDLVTRRAVERDSNEWRRRTVLGALTQVAQVRD